MNDWRIILNDIEQDPDVFEIKMDGFSAWTILKETLYVRLMPELSRTRYEKIRGKVHRYILYFARYYSQLFKWYLLRKKIVNQKNPIVLFFLQASNYYFDEKSKVRNPFGGDLAQSEKDYKIVTIETRKDFEGPKIALNCTKFSENFLVFNNLGILFNPFRKKYVNNVLRDLFRIIKRNVGNKIYYEKFREKFFSKHVFRSLYYFNYDLNKALSLLSYLKPKLVIFSATNALSGVIGACKILGIKIVEYQHGIIDDYHPSYIFPSTVKFIKEKLIIPDNLLVWGEYDKKTLLKSGFWEENQIIPIGLQKIQDSREFYHRSEIIKKNDTNLTLLYTTSYPLRNEALNFFKEFLKLISKEKLYLKLWIKLHPLEDSDYKFYKVLEDEFPKRCNVFYHKKKNLYEAFVKSDIHLSVYSASILESIYFGVPTYILNFQGKDYFNDLINLGVIKFVKDEITLLNICKKILYNRNILEEAKKECFNFGKYFFTDNATIRLNNYIHSNLL